MSILISAEDLLARQRVATGALAPLAAGLRRELEPLVASPPEVPTLKAHLSRAGGRCEHDGALLAYDPFDARHRCPVCARELAEGIADVTLAILPRAGHFVFAEQPERFREVVLGFLRGG